MTNSPNIIPAFAFVAGPNGSGKTTAANEYVKKRFHHLPHRCADNYVKEWQVSGKFPYDTLDQLNLRAANEVDANVRGFIKTHTPFIVETVLSSGKYCPDVDRARSSGLLFWLVYVTTLHPDLNIDRVRQRVRLGGHDVPTERIIKRWDASMDALPWFAARADKLIVIDNSQHNKPIPIALRRYRKTLEFTGQSKGHPAFDRLADVVGRFALRPE